MSETSTPEKRPRLIRRKRELTTDEPATVGWVRGLISAPAVLSILWPAILLVAGYAAWQTWWADYFAVTYHGIDAQQISVTPPPEYVRTDIIDAVYTETAMKDMSLLDPQVSAKVASAFASHPWVHRVVGVRKKAQGRLDVRLDYRLPVAMVYVVDPKTGPGFLVVDGEGTLLPSDFAPSETDHYLHIIVPGAYHTGRLGSPFGDTRVHAAALLARLLAPHRETLKLQSIGVHGDLRQNPIVQLEIANQDGERWFWGSPPGEEVAGEIPALMKLQAMLAGVPTGTDLRQVQLQP
ncbi:MAG: hypothetical protein ACF8AM_15300 [Rhodopirellula sp. JB055]|uniref:hypothetical protein n=1 Tax=Rhodopirellula sp. JB055 TaxID=3342846 RepID=UPI00370A33A9